MMQFTVLYFAQLGEQAQKASETVVGEFADLSSLYQYLADKYQFTLSSTQLRVARNQAFANWQDAPQNGDEIAFIPPVAGG